MNRICPRRAALIFLGILALLIAAPVVLTWRQVRQERLNRNLIAAVKRNDDRAVVTLLNQGADANCRDEPVRNFSLWQTLMQVVRGRRSNPSLGPPPLLIAMQATRRPQGAWLEWVNPPENILLFRALLDHGAHVNETDPQGYTLLWWAIRDMPDRTIRLLLAYGANAREDGLLVDAVSRSTGVDVITDLMDRGADVNQQGEFGNTALSVAVQQGQGDVVRLLLARHADPTIPDDDKKTPLVYAREDKSPKGRQIVRLLRAAGAKP